MKKLFNTNTCALVLFTSLYKHNSIVHPFQHNRKLIYIERILSSCIGCTGVSWLSHTSTYVTKATDYFFLHASAEVRGENAPEGKFASTEDRTHNRPVMRPTQSPMSLPGGRIINEDLSKIQTICRRQF